MINLHCRNSEPRMSAWDQKRRFESRPVTSGPRTLRPNEFLPNASEIRDSSRYSGVPLWQCVSSKKRYDSTPHLISNHTRSPSTSNLTAQYSVLHEFAVGACSRDDASEAKFHR